MAESWGEKFREQPPPSCARSAMPPPALPGVWGNRYAGNRHLKGIPTFGSTQTIFAVIRTEHHIIWNRTNTRRGRGGARYNIAFRVIYNPSLHSRGEAFPQPVWFKNHPQVANFWSMGWFARSSRSWRALRQPRKYLKNRFGRCPKRNGRKSSKPEDGECGNCERNPSSGKRARAAND